MTLASHHQITWRDRGEKTFKCKKCDKCFSRSSSLKEHERTHTEEKPFNCSKCYKSFSIATHLKEYERTHMGEKPFKCTNCNKSFSISSYLKNHEKIQSGEIPCKCRNRDKNFSTSWYLETHETTQEIWHSSAQSVTKVFQDQGPWRSIRGPTKNRAFWILNEKSFSKGGHLREHERTHTREKSFEWTKYDNTFSKSNYLKNYEMIHSGEKPFYCTKFDNVLQDQLPWRSMRAPTTEERSLLINQNVTRTSH